MILLNETFVQQKFIKRMSDGINVMNLFNTTCNSITEVYEYTLEHASEQLSRMEQEKESKIFKEANI